MWTPRSIKVLKKDGKFFSVCVVSAYSVMKTTHRDFRGPNNCLRVYGIVRNLDAQHSKNCFGLSDREKNKKKHNFPVLARYTRFLTIFDGGKLHEFSVGADCVPGNESTLMDENFAIGNDNKNQ